MKHLKLKIFFFIIINLILNFSVNAIDDTCYTPDFTCRTKQEGMTCNKGLNPDKVKCCCQSEAGISYGFYDRNKLIASMVNDVQKSKKLKNPEDHTTLPNNVSSSSIQSTKSPIKNSEHGVNPSNDSSK
jgi:hypothetical protein